MMNKIKELEDKIVYHSQKYYEGEAEISDAEFDALEAELKEIDPDNKILKTIGYGYQPVGKKIKHTIPIGGISNKIKAKDLPKKLSVLPEFFQVEPKYDGGSITVYYKDGRIDKAITRGDGVEGVDITENMKLLVANEISEKRPVAIKGEIIVTENNFEKYFKPLGYTNMRNTPNGVIKSEHLDKELVSKLRFIACDLVGFISNGVTDRPTKPPELEWTKFLVMSPEIFRDDFLDSKISRELVILEDGSTYCYDGWVLKTTEEHIEYVDNNWLSIVPDSIFAYKFEEELYETVVKDIEWNYSRTGKYIPTIIIKEVEIDGAKINRASGNNYEWVVYRGLGIGSKIIIIRANEVIPKVENVLTESMDNKIPWKCEICESILEFRGKDLCCVNPSCQGKETETIYRILELMGVEGIGRAIIDKILVEYKVDTIESFINFLEFYKQSKPVSRIRSIVGNKTGDKFISILNKITSGYKPKISDVLYCANIPSFGSTLCERYNAIANEKFIETFCSSYELPEEWLDYDVNYLNREWLVKEETLFKIKSILFIFNYELLEKAKKKDLLNITVAVTGSTIITRDKWFKQLEQFGIKKASSLKKGIKFLISNDNLSGTSKIEKAKKYGIEIISERDFYEWIADSLIMDYKDVTNKIKGE